MAYTKASPLAYFSGISQECTLHTTTLEGIIPSMVGRVLLLRQKVQYDIEKL